jgi:hypothetical protein
MYSQETEYDYLNSLNLFLILASALEQAQSLTEIKVQAPALYSVLS